MKNLVGYIRVSSKEQLEGSSLDVQEKIIRDYAARNDSEIVKVFVE